MPQQYFVGSKAVASVVDTGKLTPLGKPMLQVFYEDGSYEYMPERRFNITRTTEKSDATGVRTRLIKVASDEIGAAAYHMLHEFGCKISDVEIVLNQTIVFVNAAAERATNLLWQVDYADERTLNQVNDILLANASKTPDNAGTSSGTGSPTQDTK